MLDVTKDFDPRRAAILEAADQIEKHPEEFNFMGARIPRTLCGRPACALAWIGYFSAMQIDNDGYPPSDVAQWLGVKGFLPELAFYERLDEFAMHWRLRADQCAYALRQYADAYHPAKVPA